MIITNKKTAIEAAKEKKLPVLMTKENADVAYTFAAGAKSKILAIDFVGIENWCRFDSEFPELKVAIYPEKPKDNKVIDLGKTTLHELISYGFNIPEKVIESIILKLKESKSIIMRRNNSLASHALAKEFNKGVVAIRLEKEDEKTVCWCNKFEKGFESEKIPFSSLLEKNLYRLEKLFDPKDLTVLDLKKLNIL